MQRSKSRVIFIAAVLAACGGDSPTSATRRLPPQPTPPPFNVLASLSDSIINGNECRYTLKFEANDSVRTVAYDWGIDVFQSELPGVGGIIGGARGSFSRTLEQVWQWKQRTPADTFNLIINYALESGTCGRHDYEHQPH